MKTSVQSNIIISTVGEQRKKETEQYFLIRVHYKKQEPAQIENLQLVTLRWKIVNKSKCNCINWQRNRNKNIEINRTVKKKKIIVDLLMLHHFDLNWLIL